MGFLLLALLGGGAGLAYPLLGLAIQLFSILLLVRAGNALRWQGLDHSSRLILAGFGAAMLLVIVQLLPLPPSFWSELPGREVAASIDAQLGWQRWRPLSLSPDLTLRAGLALLPPLAAFLLIAASDEARRMGLLRIVVAVALGGSLLAFLQVAMGQGAPLLYETAHRGSGVGPFVNRNHHALLLLIAILLAAIPGIVPSRVGRGRRQVSPRLVAVAPIAMAVLLALGVIATSSRTALVLLPLCLMLSAGIMARGRVRPAWLGMVAGLYLIGGILLAQTDALRHVIARFDWLSQDLRFQYWDNSLYALKASFPWGTGLGSFGAVYPTVEPLAQVGQLRVNHAHNDLIELVLEGGAPALLLLLFMGGVIAYAVHAALRSRRLDREAIVAAAGGIGLILAFSCVDFPLRMDAIACVFGVLLGLLVKWHAPSDKTGQNRMRKLALVPAVALAGLCGASMLGEALALRGYPHLAVHIAPWSVSSWEAHALKKQVSGAQREARDAAASALAIAPLSAGAVRAHGIADLELGAQDRGAALLLAGAALGWRDGIHQLWLAEAAIAAGNATVAAERIDALLRRDLFSGEMVDQLRGLLDLNGGADAITTRLRDRPGWRAGFLNALAQDIPLRAAEVQDLLRRMRGAGIGATPRETALMRWRAAEAGEYDLARQIWSDSGTRTLMGEGGFEQLATPLPERAAPYSWAAPRVPGVRLGAVEGGGRHGDALRISSSGLSGGEVLFQVVMLAPGHYMFGHLVRADSGDAAGDPPVWRITCLDGRLLSVIAMAQPGVGSSRWQPVEGKFEVPSDCSAQKLALFFAPSQGGKRSMLIDDLSLRTLRRNIVGDKVSPGP